MFERLTAFLAGVGRIGVFMKNKAPINKKVGFQILDI
jgi:hypothetical protein